MKRLISVMIVLTLLLSGCQPVSTPEATETPTVPVQTEPQATEASPATEATTAATEPSKPSYAQQTMLAVSMPCVQEYTYNADSVLVFQHSYQTMQITNQDPEVANSIILDYLSRMESVRANAAEYSAEAELTHPGNEAEPFFYDVLYSATRIDQSVLSLSGVSSIYLNDRPSQTGIAANYNMLTGDVLTLGSILTDVKAKEDLASLVVAAADTVSRQTELFDDYADCIAERFSREESFDEDWYFTDTGLAFYFSTYEIAPYSSGIVTLEVPYASLTGIIADEYFPPEEEILTGNLQVNLLGEVDLSNFSQIAEVVQIVGSERLDIQPEKFLLFAEGAVQNFRVQYGTWDENSTVYTPSCTILASAALTPGDAVMLQCFLPETAPAIQITFESDGQQVALYLTLSGIDGSAVLTES